LFFIFWFIYKRFWRLFLLNDVYLNSQNGDHIKITFISVNGTRTECDAQDIIKQRTIRDMTELTILKSGEVIKKYCAISSKENLRYLGG
jgi:ribonucleotide monophosphatase NagD (HAD superfamily)